MKTLYYTACSLDGFIATPDHNLDWLFALGEPEGSAMPECLREVGALAMGASTYEWLWRRAVGPEACHPEPWPYAEPVWVFSHRTLPAVPGADIRFVSGAVEPVHAAMRAAAGERNIWLIGGGELVGRFHDAGLLDTLIVTLCSVTLGAGMPLLPRPLLPPTLRLDSVRQLGPGFVELAYSVIREPRA